jgi:hypothetical protein
MMDFVVGIDRLSAAGQRGEIGVAIVPVHIK